MKHDFDDLRHAEAGVPVSRYVYRGETGNPVLIANRFERPDGDKFYLPYDVVKEIWKAPEARPLNNLDKIVAADPATPILFVEGERCADALSKLGYLTTTTLGGSNASQKTDLSPLAGRSIIFWADYNEPGFPTKPRSEIT